MFVVYSVILGLERNEHKVLFARILQGGKLVNYQGREWQVARPCVATVAEPYM